MIHNDPRQSAMTHKYPIYKKKIKKTEIDIYTWYFLVGKENKSKSKEEKKEKKSPLQDLNHWCQQTTVLKADHLTALSSAMSISLLSGSE